MLREVLRKGKTGKPDFCKSLIPRGKNGAGEEIRTLDIFVGNEVLYQLSYTRVIEAGLNREVFYFVQGVF